jgi:hypothetical protein
MADNTLTGRCLQAHHEAVGWEYVTSPAGIRAVIEHLAAELTVMGHIEAGRSLLAQLNAQVIPLRRQPAPDAPA